MFLFLVYIVLLLCLLHCVFKYNATTRAIRKMPMFKEDFLLGNALAIIVSPVELFKLGRKYAALYNIYGWYAFLIRSVNIYTPEDIEIVVSTTKHSHKSFIYGIIKPWLREGLLVSNGDKWLERRRILTPAFHFEILKKYLMVFENNSQSLVVNLLKTKGEAIDIIPVLSDYTLSTICETAMGTKLHEETSTEGKMYKNAIHKLGFLFVERMSKVYYLPDIIFNCSAYGRLSTKYLNTVKSFTKRIIKERKEFLDKHGIAENMKNKLDVDYQDMFLARKKKKAAMLDLMIFAEKQGFIDGDGIEEEVDTFMFEGHDTTAAGLTFILMVLANHKNVQDKILEELIAVFGDSTAPATIEGLNSLKYLECCIKESLRLYPPVPFISRNISEPVVLSGYEIPAGVQCHIHIFDLHRRPDLYENPTKFDPDRFLPENSVGRHAYAYVPFSAGPRNCIGQKFAMLELKSCLAAILRKFELQPVTTPEDVEFIAHLVLRCTKPIYVKFIERV